MPSFLNKIKGAFTSPSTQRKSQSQNQTPPLSARSTATVPTVHIPNVYSVKEKELPKLHAAAWRGDIDKVTELCRPDKINTFDKDGRTPLHLAIAANHLKVAEQLLTEDAKFQFDRESRSPMIIAAQVGSPKMMELLLNYLEDRQKNIINMPDRTGLNPLLYAVKNDNLSLLQILLREKRINLDYSDQVKFS